MQSQDHHVEAVRLRVLWCGGTAQNALPAAVRNALGAVHRLPKTALTSLALPLARLSCLY
jgi:hypothetical protein